MRLLTISGVLPLLFPSAVSAQAEVVTITPEQIGQIFCIGSLGNDMSPVKPLLSPGLDAMIDDAFARSDALAIEHPGDKPPLGDGVPWRTWPDYADGCTIAATDIDDGSARVTIAYSFSEYPDANYSNDLVIIMSEEPFWFIDDIELGEGRTLRSALAAAFEQ